MALRRTNSFPGPGPEKDNLVPRTFTLAWTFTQDLYPSQGKGLGNEVVRRSLP